MALTLVYKKCQVWLCQESADFITAPLFFPLPLFFKNDISACNADISSSLNITCIVKLSSSNSGGWSPTPYLVKINNSNPRI